MHLQEHPQKRTNFDGEPWLGLMIRIPFGKDKINGINAKIILLKKQVSANDQEINTHRQTVKKIKGLENITTIGELNENLKIYEAIELDPI